MATSIPQEIENGASTPPIRMAIVGMDAILGGCNGIDALGESIYSGTKSFDLVYLSKHSERDAVIPVARVSSFDLDLVDLGISPDEVNDLPPEDLLMLKVARRALLDSGLDGESEQSRQIAVIVIAGSNRLMSPKSVARSAGYDAAGISLPSRISNLWDLSGPNLSISTGQSPLQHALRISARILEGREADAVLVGAIDLLHNDPEQFPDDGSNIPGPEGNHPSPPQGEGAAAIILKRYSEAKSDRVHIYGVIGNISEVEEDGNLFLDADPVTAHELACKEALAQNDLTPCDVGYLECATWASTQYNLEAKLGLGRSYTQPGAGLTCAVGSIQTVIGDTRRLTGLAGLIKIAWCLYHRILPASTDKFAPEITNDLSTSPFYIPSGSKTWFAGQRQRRVAALHDLARDGSGGHILITDEGSNSLPENHFLTRQAFRLVPVAADTPQEIQAKLSHLRESLSEGNDYQDLSTKAMRDYLAHPAKGYALGLVGGSRDELYKEIEFAAGGIETAVGNQGDWQTPLGSYFTANPLGKSGGVSFVYPGAFNSFIGLGKDLFHLFPNIYASFSDQTSDMGEVLQELILYPRSLLELTPGELEAYETRLNQDAIAMLTSGTSMAVLFTLVLREYFGIHPRSAFGYSLGETSMFFATQVWKDADPGNNRLNSSPLFRSQLTGPKNAVRSYWGLPSGQVNGNDDSLWQNFLLMTTPEKVKGELAFEDHVYLTHINTPRQVVIGGDPQSCKNVIQRLHCSSLRAPFDHVLHCEPMASVFPELVRLHTYPIYHTPNIALYSAAGYGTVELDSQTIAHSIAKTLCSPLDFPRLVNQVYADGARIFVELGAGSNSAKWIGEILKGQPHAAMSINRKGADDYTSIVRLLAKLVSHRVPMDLSPLVPPLSARETIPSLVRTITLSDYRGF